MRIRLHAWEAASRSNGPGLRAVIWMQGCTIGCPGCFNPTTHDPRAGYEMNTEDLARTILAACSDIQGVSISGGEPFQQPEALFDLAKCFRAAGLSVLVFSGYAIERIKRLSLGPDILDALDVLVAGPYVQSLHAGRGLIGSSNQRIHLLSGRYRYTDLAAVPSGEIILHRDGTVTLTGIRPLRDPYSGAPAPLA